MTVEFPIAVLIADLKNGKTVSMNYNGATFTTRVLDGLDNTLDETIGTAKMSDALRVVADMMDKHD